MRKDYKAGDTCQECKKEVLTDGRCDWCAFKEFEARQFEAELNSDNPDFSEFYPDGEQFI